MKRLNWLFVLVVLVMVFSINQPARAEVISVAVIKFETPDGEFSCLGERPDGSRELLPFVNRGTRIDGFICGSVIPETEFFLSANGKKIDPSSINLIQMEEKKLAEVLEKASFGASLSEGIEIEKAATETALLSTVNPRVPKTKLVHQVVKGECLWNIAESQYQNGFLHLAIARENQIDNPEIIHPGQELVIPAKDKALALFRSRKNNKQIQVAQAVLKEPETTQALERQVKPLEEKNLETEVRIETKNLEQEIRELKKKNKLYKNGMDTLNEVLAERDAEIASLKRTLLGKEEEIKKLESRKEIKELKSKAESIRKTLIEERTERKKLEKFYENLGIKKPAVEISDRSKPASPISLNQFEKEVIQKEKESINPKKNLRQWAAGVCQWAAGKILNLWRESEKDP